MTEMVAFGKYRVVGKKAARGSWILYDVVEVALERKAELRVYSNRLPEGSAKEKEFLDTLMKVADLDHPHVVNVWDMGVVMEKGYYTCPPRDAVPLAEAFAERELSFLDETQLLEAASQLCSGLQALHEVGITHGAICTESIYWDRRRCNPFFSWIPILARSPDELRFQLPHVPMDYAGEAEDIYRLAGILHHLTTGTGPLSDAEVTGATAAVNVPGAIDGVYEILEQALAQDPRENYASVADLGKAFERVLSKQRVRAELEKSVSSMVIPEEVLQKALEKKKEQKRRRRQKEGVSAAEAPYVSPLEMPQGKAIGFGAVFLLLLGSYALIGPGDTAPARPQPRPKPRKLAPKRPPVKRSSTTSTTTRKKPDEETRGPKKRGKQAVLELKDAAPTSSSDFLGRWGVLKGWILSLPPAKRRNLFTYGKLVRLRAEYKKDEYGACRKLDDLIRQAVNEAE